MLPRVKVRGHALCADWGDTEFSKTLDAGTRVVHGEDVDIAEVQQEMLKWTPGHKDMALKADRAVSAAHKILAASRLRNPLSSNTSDV